MDAANAHRLWQALGVGHTAFLYSGLFDDELTASLVSLAEGLLSRDDDRTQRNKLAFIMVEAYQNIVRHRARLPKITEQGAGRSLFWVQHEGQGAQVIAMDPVLRAEAIALAKSLQQIKGLDIAQLKDLFLRGLQGVSRSERGGAGLGLIEMTRRSGHELGHVFFDLDADHQLFLLSVVLGDAPAESTLRSKAKEVHELVAREDVIMAFQGRLTTPMKHVLLRVVPKELEEEVFSTERTQALMLAAFEWIRDVGASNEHAMVAITRCAGMPSLVLGIPLGHSTMEQTMDNSAIFRDASAAERQKLYRDTLLGREKALPRQFLGLLDMARLCPEPLVVEAGPSEGKSWLMVRSCL
ncbi:MAG: SiaB family protein kinase [Flavobacteriales bacterium]|nr:SiaB family protein kinase [Flavobacteriales bacterium]